MPTLPQEPAARAESRAPIVSERSVPRIDARPAPKNEASLQDRAERYTDGVLREPPPALEGFMPDPRPKLQTPPPDVQPMVRAEQVPSFLPDAPKPMRFIGTVFDTYIMVEYEDQLLLIDQHAVHERLLFDRMMKLYDTQRAGQELLVPLVCTVTRHEQALLNENRQLLEKIGLAVEPFGDNEVSIRTIPMLMGEPQTTDFLRDILAQLESERGTVTL